MTTQQPGNPRRRRIAGERRASRPVEAPSEPPRNGKAAQLAEPPATRPRRTRRPVRRSDGWWGSAASLVALAVTLVVLLTLVVLGALGLLGNQGIQEIREARAAEQAGGPASAAAERAAAAILAYDHRSLAADKDAAVRFMTDSFGEQYSETFEKVVTPAAEQTNARVTAEVQASAVIREAADRVRVLLFVDQTTRSNANEGPQLALNRVEMIMVEQGESWLVDDITSY